MTRHLTFALGLALASSFVVPQVAMAQGGPFLQKFKRDVEEARRDLRRKLGVDVRVERERAPRASTPRGPVIRRESGLVETSIRPALRPGAEVVATPAVATSLPSSEAGRELELRLRLAVEEGALAPEVAQVIRAGRFPTMEDLEARTAGLGNGWLPGGATLALESGKVACDDGGAGGCERLADDPSLADMREEIAVIEAQAESVQAVAAVPGLAGAMAAVEEERSAEAEAPREYPVARGDELPSIDSLLDAQSE
ncbi:hypothetical protein [Oceanicola sp. 502str15]|uniref:hypothetical protein n=1 Tax=Oceanicola sp. 502str15 TaxID=2696061 RepID=UPI002095F76C|nr:hypothetical protein [Oceanicola sp. 502str15]MCO6382438.1 hypothetical protein [Oceanicola sp. 502str15]